MGTGLRKVLSIQCLHTLVYMGKNKINNKNDNINNTILDSNSLIHPHVNLSIYIFFFFLLSVKEVEIGEIYGEASEDGVEEYVECTYNLLPELQPKWSGPDGLEIAGKYEEDNLSVYMYWGDS